MPAKLIDTADGNKDALMRFAGGRVLGLELGEDLLQETFLTAFCHWSQFDGSSAFGTRLVAILRRMIVGHLRKRERSPDLANTAGSPRFFELAEVGKPTRICVSPIKVVAFIP